ncbi:MAG: radical SAM protein [Coriobacteriia bacterium]|nr:radical SAM protein [Coriobacteriia bacterium]
MRDIDKTTAVCPDCLRELPAILYEDDNRVWMRRTCPEHGEFKSYIWPDFDHYSWIMDQELPKVAPQNTIARTKACPLGCGTCSRHERKQTLLEIEVTQACNLRCPVCFMSADNHKHDPTLEEIGIMYETIKSAAGVDGAVQLTGGEPTMRKNLAEIIKMGRDKGFWGIELNTNGLIIATRDGYLEELVEAGLTGVYLSFDGLTSEVYEATCGRDILKQKLRAVERCREANIQVVLATTVIKGLNDQQLGDLLKFALDNIDVVAGLALQPAFTSGRFDAEHLPLTMGDVIFELAEQSDGILEPHDIWSLGCAHPLCDTGTLLIANKDNPQSYEAITRHITHDDFKARFNPSSPQGSVFFDIAEDLQLDYSRSLSLIIMNYMDAYNLDTQRLRECSMSVAMPNGNIIPFCAYHLTNSQGKRVYPPWMKAHLA